MVDQSAGFTGSIPEIYDRHLGPVLFDGYARDLVSRVAEARPQRILETAAGTGILTSLLAKAMPAADIVATDLNAPMLEVARTKIEPGGRVALQTADATALPFPDASFDAAICQFGVMFYPDKDKSYREIHRVLRPGGRYFFSVWDSRSRNPFAACMAGLLKAHFPTDTPPFYEVPFGYHRLDPIKDSLEAAGLTDIRVYVLPARRPVADVAGFARGAIFGIPLIDQIKARGIDGDSLRAEAEAKLKALFGTPAIAEMQAILCKARKP